MEKYGGVSKGDIITQVNGVSLFGKVVVGCCLLLLLLLLAVVVVVVVVDV